MNDPIKSPVTENKDDEMLSGSQSEVAKDSKEEESKEEESKEEESKESQKSEDIAQESQGAGDRTELATEKKVGELEGTTTSSEDIYLSEGNEASPETETEMSVSQHASSEALSETSSFDREEKAGLSSIKTPLEDEEMGSALHRESHDETPTLSQQDSHLGSAHSFSASASASTLRLRDTQLTDELRKTLENIQNPGKVHAHHKGFIHVVEEHIPTVAKNGDRLFEASADFADSSHPRLDSTFEGLSLAFTSLEWIRIPILYAVAWLDGDVSKAVTAPRNVRFTYTTILMALSIVALAIPAVAVPITLALSALSLGGSLFSIYRYVQRKQFYKKELAVINEELQQLESHDDLKVKAKKIEEELNEAVKNNDPGKIRTLHAQGNALQNKVNHLNEVLKRKELTEGKLEKYGTSLLVKRATVVALGSLALIGLAVSLAFPPVGGAIFIAAFTGTIVSLVARASYSLYQRFRNNNKHAHQAAPTATPTNTLHSQPQPHPQPHPQPDLSDEHESTAQIVERLADAAHRVHHEEDKIALGFSINNADDSTPDLELEPKTEPAPAPTHEVETPKEVTPDQVASTTAEANLEPELVDVTEEPAHLRESKVEQDSVVPQKPEKLRAVDSEEMDGIQLASLFAKEIQSVSPDRDESKRSSLKTALKDEIESLKEVTQEKKTETVVEDEKKEEDDDDGENLGLH